MNHLWNIIKQTKLVPVLAALALPALVQAQSGPELLTVNPDARSAAMGDASLGRAKRMYIYTNPSAIFSTDCLVDASVSFMGYSKFDGVDGRQWGTAVGLAGRLGERHAVFGGFRYIGGLKLEAFSEQGIDRNYTIKPADYTIDLGYAYSISRHWAAHAVLSYVNSQIGQMGETMAAAVGISRIDELLLGNRFYYWRTQVQVSNLGPELTYGKEAKVKLPTTLALGTELATSFTPSWSAALAVGARHQLKAGETKARTDINVGAEASFRQWSLRAGSVIRTDDSPSMLTAGLGFDGYGFEVSAAYQVAASKSDAGDRFSRMLLGLRYNF